MDLTPGVQLRARGLTWDLLSVEPLLGHSAEQCRLRLRCRGGDLAGLEWALLHPAEPIEILSGDPDPTCPGPLAAWQLRHRAEVLNRIPDVDEMLATEPGRLDIAPYQLVPLMRALELPRPRLLLADGVGLGKTVQAGLIAAELIARGRAHRILIVAPSGPLLVQWDREMRARFGLRFTRLADHADLRRERRRLEPGANPFGHAALCLTALDFAKQERVLEELDRVDWDLVLIDEAHHCVADSVGLDAGATQRRRLAELLAARSDGLLLLTATPHDGHDAHFASLIALLDPSLTDGAGGLIGLGYRRHVVRRLKTHLRDPRTGAPLFRNRRIVPVRIDDVAEPVRRFHLALADLVIPRLRRSDAARGPGDALAFVSLLKRSGSTVAACLATLRVVAERYARDDVGDTALRRDRARRLRAYRRRARRFGVLDVGDEREQEALEVEGIAAELRRTDGVAADLAGLIATGEAALPFDPRIETLLIEIRLIRIAHPEANILIYTEYADSQRAVAEALAGARGIAGAVLTIGGADTEAERIRAADRCAEEAPVILISTDALAEGLNLHRRCHHLIHLDLPYNPNRLEQRNGRIDRYGQCHDPEIRYLFQAGTFEESVLLRLIAKYEKARAMLSFMPDALGLTAPSDALNEGLLTGFAERRRSLFDTEEPVLVGIADSAEAAETDALREVLREIDRAYTGVDHMAARHGWLTERKDTPLDPGFFNVAQAGLSDFAAAALDASSAALDRFVVPSAWAPALDGLPGFDAARSELRITTDRDRLRAEDGAELGFLGRAHPLTRRLIDRVGGQGEQGRVAVAHADPAIGCAVLLTYVIEIRSAVRLELREPIGVLLCESGAPPCVLDRHALTRFLTTACTDAAIDPWNSDFRAWVEPRLAEAAALAHDEQARLLTELRSRAEGRRDVRLDRLGRWLLVRAVALLGAAAPAIDDLFGDRSGEGADASSPLQRLLACISDPSADAPAKRDAAAVVGLYERAMRETDDLARLTAEPPRWLGVLMLADERAA